MQSKLKTLDDIYGFTVEQSSMSRGNFMELTIVLILILELVLLLLGITEQRSPGALLRRPRSRCDTA